MGRQTKNATIKSAFLGIEDHGCFTYMLSLHFDGCAQGFGGIRLDKSPLCSVLLRNLLETVGVSSWAELDGNHVRVDCDFEKIYRIGHIIEDQWYDPRAIVDEATQ